MCHLHLCSGLKSFYGPPFKNHLLPLSIIYIPRQDKGGLQSSHILTWLRFASSEVCGRLQISFNVIKSKRFLWSLSNDSWIVFLLLIFPKRRILYKHNWEKTTLNWGSKQPCSTESIRYPRPQGFGTDRGEGYKHACTHTQTLFPTLWQWIP